MLKFRGTVTIPLVLMLAGFWEGILLPSLFSTPGDQSFVFHCLMFPLHAVTVLLLKEETPLHVWRQ